MRDRRALILAGIAALAVAAIAAGVVARWARGPEIAFMPGPLGREPVSRALLRRISPARRAGDADTPRPAASAKAPADRLPLERGAGFLTRVIGLRSGEEEAWGRDNGLTPPIQFSHHLAQVFPPALAATHPEFFPLVAGRRLQPPPGSGFWNPDLGREDVAQHAAKEAEAFFRQNPDAVSFSLGINDGLIFGESPETLAFVQPPRWFRGRPDYSRLVFTFMNRAAADLARTWPDRYLGCLAYYWAENAPPFAVDRHVIPFLTADRTQSYDPAFVREEFALQDRWAAVMGVGAVRRGDPVSSRGVKPLPQRSDATPVGGPRLGMYDYLDGQGFLVPRVPIHALAMHLRHAYEAGFTDYYAESSRNWGLDGPLPWVIARLLEDPEQDVDALLDVYYAAYFQAAAAPMREFFAGCEAQWMHQPGPSYWLKHFRNQSQAALYPPEVRAELRALLERAAAAANNDRVRRRVAFVSDSFAVTERFAAFQEARAALDGAVAQRADVSVLRPKLAEYFGRRAEFVRALDDVTHRSPLAFYPVNTYDFLRDDPGFAATLRLASEDISRVTTAAPAQAPDDPFAESTWRTARQAAAAFPGGRGREIVRAGNFEGPVPDGERIAGLTFGLDLPAPWQSAVEPTERGEGRLTDAGDRAVEGPHERVLRIGGAQNTTVYQWVPVTGNRLYLGAVRARGRVSLSDAVTLTLGFLDARQRPTGKVVVMRLPDGEWPEWVSLQQAEAAPADAAWAGIGIRIQNQVAGDWAEFTGISLREIR